VEPGQAAGHLALPLSATTGAFSSVLIVKSGAGTLLGIAGFNNGPGQYVLLFDGTAQPPAGAVPQLPMFVPASSNFAISWGRWGRPFRRGIVGEIRALAKRAF